MKVNLNGKVAVVTGGSGVLCSEMAVALAVSGAKVAVLYNSKRESAEEVVSRIEEAGGSAIAVCGNVLDKGSLEEARELVERELGVCDILVNGAGGNNPKGTTTGEYLERCDIDSDIQKTFFDLAPEGVEFVFNLNFLGTLLATQVFCRGMAKKGGTVINISSMNAFTPLTKIPAYSGAKAAISNFTRWLAVHFSHVGIRVNAIAPGFFLTDQNRALLTNGDGTLSPRGEKIIAHTPMGRFGTPGDLTGALLFLADEEASSFVNGVVLPVDGAFSAFSGV